MIVIVDNVLIAPSKGILPRTINPEEVPYIFGDIYELDTWYPGDLAELDSPYILRDYRAQVVKVNLFQYNPVEKTLRVYTELTIEVYPNGPGEINVLNREEPLTKIDKDFDLVYNNQFINYNEL